MVPLTEILDKIRTYHEHADTELINRAYVYAARMHQGQLRKSGDPYFVHPVSVAEVIAEMHLDTASVCAALLHDVVEDTEVTQEQLAAEFGDEIAFLVEGVTKLGKLSFGTREDRQAESFRKMLLAMSRDIRVLLVKLADRLDNMRTLHYMSVDSQERISRETLDIYAPLSGRLGIQWLKDELEDLAFKYIYPEAYAHVSGKLERANRDADRYIGNVVAQLTDLLGEAGISVDSVTGRVKHPFSIYRKMREQQCDFERIHDLMAFRVVVPELADCYGALGITHSQFTPVPGRFKDYIALPKSNMYQSLHTTVIGPEHRRVEIQIRTVDMHRTADMGIAAHWNYKDGALLDEEDKSRFRWLRELMEYQKEVDDPEEFIDGVRVDLFADEVYVFTPRGDVRVFPRGATPVDFAYAVHSEVGEHCTGARVNGSIVPLRYKLHNGDTVEILTSDRQRPNKDWLDFVVSARARTRIRSYIRGEERKRSVQLGRELLERELRQRQLSYQKASKRGDIVRAAKKLNLASDTELLYQLGYGQVQPEDAVEAIAPADDKGKEKELRPSLIEKTVSRVTGQRGAVMIGGVDEVLVRFAKCCSPLPGEPISGFITRGRGVTVHRKGCERALSLEPERRIDCNWKRDASIQLPATLRIVTADRPGILALLSRAFNDAGVNINEATCRASVQGRSVNTFQFQVPEVGKLRSLMRELARVDGVYEVERI
ncbi:MAG: bifunctional (p)ppGpp synthetase/guanosine-3',5'-bis(diphosphate) 3'-pyrophosphohydrolase [Myxococcales bacterium]|nr:bifunctional (p)ppGpp synthetase/guanosine-3',5'-bis(diphosphate) 3'-pyrophosphohydrolase [Myxococcales bacterium]